MLVLPNMERFFTVRMLVFLKVGPKLDDKQNDKATEHVDRNYILYVCSWIKRMSEKDYQEAMKELVPRPSLHQKDYFRLMEIHKAN